MNDIIFNKKDIESGNLFSATTIYCETPYILRGEFKDGEFMIAEEKPIYNLTSEMFEKIPQYFLFMSQTHKFKVDKIGFRNFNRIESPHNKKSFTQVFDVINGTFHKF